MVLRKESIMSLYGLLCGTRHEGHVIGGSQRYRLLLISCVQGLPWAVNYYSSFQEIPSVYGTQWPINVFTKVHRWAIQRICPRLRQCVSSLWSRYGEIYVSYPGPQAGGTSRIGCPGMHRSIGIRIFAAIPRIWKTSPPSTTSDYAMSWWQGTQHGRCATFLVGWPSA
jgi:hypothetical protein